MDVFNDKQYGYLFKHPKDWQANIYRSGVVVSEVKNSTHKSGVNLRIYNLRVAEKTFLDDYVDDMYVSLRAKAYDIDRSFVDSIVTYDIYLKSISGKDEYSYRHWLPFFPDQKLVFVLQAGCPSSRAFRSSEPTLGSLTICFYTGGWVYD